MKSKIKVIRRVPMPNGVTRVVSLIDGWKEVISYERKSAKKKGKKK